MNTIRRRSAVPFLFLLLVSAGPMGAQQAAPDSPIFASGARLEQLFAAGEFTEGPAAGPDGSIYFSDLTWGSATRREDGHIWRFDPGTRACSVFRSPSSMSNGIAFDATGAMLVVVGSDFGGRGILRTDMSTGKSEILSAEFGGLPYNSPNDLVLDSHGRVYFTDPRYGDGASVVQPVQAVYRLDTDGKVSRLIVSVSKPNGIAISPDCRTLYVGCYDEEEPTMAIWAFDLNDRGDIAGGRTIAEFAPEVGPDGMTVDSEGLLYVAIRDEEAPRIGVYDSTGRLAATLPLPEVPSNVEFGQPPADSLLYVTAGGSLYRIATVRHRLTFVPKGE